MIALAFTRSSDRPPPVLDTLDVAADGSWRAWRSIGEVIGRFAGTDAAALVALAQRAVAEPPPPTGELPADASVDRITLGDDRARAVIASSARPAGAWGELVDACRTAIQRAADQPSAAIAIVVQGHDLVRLEHRGSDTLALELAGIQVNAQLWAPDGTYIASGSGHVDAGRVETGPDWCLDIPLDGIDPAAAGELLVSVSFVAEDGGIYVPVMLAAGRAPG